MRAETPEKETEVEKRRGVGGEGRERRTIVHTRRMFPLVIVRRVQSIKPIKALAK